MVLQLNCLNMGVLILKLGLENNEVRLEPYNQEWKDEFLRVKNDLLNKTDLQASRIEHIGSTAIEGMSAKPIIDIVAGVDDLESVDKEFFIDLSKVGFLRLRVERPGEIVLAKFSDDTYKIKTHFLHLVEYDGELWNNLIFFRDYLNTHEDVRKGYLDIKQNFLKHSSTGIKEYTDSKEVFVREIYGKRDSN